jgi:Ni/Co efflux regulator RcnB
MAGVAALLALNVGAVAAQGRGHGRGHGENRGQARKAEREAEARFSDHDRQMAYNWYAHERRGPAEHENLPPGLRRGELPPGLRDRDRLPPGLEARFRPGFVFTEDLRPQLYPVPEVLVRRFPPPPTGCRYLAFGGHIVLVDAAFRLLDAINLRISVAR